MSGHLPVPTNSRATIGFLIAFCPLRLRAILKQTLRNAYYRYAFGGDSTFERRWGALVRRLEKNIRAGDIPRSRQVWEGEYGAAGWHHLAGLEELNRYTVIAGYIEILKRGAAVLDIGCGEGLLLSCLGFDYRHYTGIDLAGSAITLAARFHRPRCQFIQADAESFTPDEKFDVIVFNEVLYYFDDPLATLARYERCLASGGLFIASLYEKSVRAMGVRRQIDKRYQVVCSLRVYANGESWLIPVFAPKPRRSWRSLLHTTKPKVPC